MSKQTDALKLALEALTHGCPPDCKDGMTDSGGAYPWGEPALIPCPNCKAITVIREALAEQPAQQEPVAWVYPEFWEHLERVGCGTAYAMDASGRHPDDVKRTPLYRNPLPDREPYAWVTFTPYGEEDDVWYENPEGQLLEGWTYKPLYDTSPPASKPWVGLTLQEIEAEWDDFMSAKSDGYVPNFVRAIETKLREKNA